MTRHELTSLFWPGQDSTKARHNMRQLLLTSRRMFPELDVRAVGDHVIYVRDALTIDYITSAELARNGRIFSALEYHTGPFLETVRPPSQEYELWVERMRAQQQRAIRSALIALHRDDLHSLAELDRRLTHLSHILGRDPIVAVTQARVAQLHGDYSKAKRILNGRTVFDAATIPLAKRLKEELRCARGRPFPSTQNAPPFVGRSGEMGALMRHWEATKQGHHCILDITGELGVGKSRLALRFAKLVVLRGGHAIVVNCADSRRALIKIITQLPRPRRDSSTRQSPSGNRTALLEDALHAIESSTVAHGLLIVFDDFQRAGGLITQLLAAVQRRHSAPTPLVIARVRRTGRTCTASLHHRVHLDNLPAAEAMILISSIIRKAISAETVRLILDHGHGNTQRVVDLSRLVAQSSNNDSIEDIIRNAGPGPSAWRAVRNRDPASLRTLILICLCRGPIPFASLRLATGLRRLELRRLIADLVDEGLVDQIDIRKVVARKEVRDIIAARRRTKDNVHYHRALARSLIGHGSKYWIEIAYHFQCAGEINLAVRYYVRAAARGVKREEREDAVGAIDSALQLDAEHEANTALTRVRADLHYQWEEYGLAAPLYKSMIKSQLRLSMRDVLRFRIRYLRCIAACTYQRTEYHALKHLVAAAKRTNDLGLEMEAANAAFSSLSDSATRPEYRALGDEFCRIAQRADDVNAARALAQAALLYMGAYKQHLALVTAKRAVERADRAASSSAEFQARVARATVLLSSGELYEATEEFTCAEGLLKSLSGPPRRQVWSVNRGVLLLERGDWEAAEAVFHEVYSDNQASASQRQNAVVAVNLALLYYETKRYGQASQFAELARTYDARGVSVSAPAIAVEGLIALDRSDEALASRCASMLTKGRPYFGDHSYAVILHSRLMRGHGDVESMAHMLFRESLKWRGRYAPGAARITLEMFEVRHVSGAAGKPLASLIQFADDCAARGLLPLASRARELIQQWY